METKKITIEVPEAIARAYEKASASDRQRAERALAVALQTREHAAAELEQILNRMSEAAARRGLTDAKLQTLLDDE